jgi:hypothetical protein
VIASIDRLLDDIEDSYVGVVVMAFANVGQYLLFLRRMQNKGMLGRYVVVYSEVLRGDIFDQVASDDRAELFDLSVGAVSVSPPGITTAATRVRNMCLRREPACSLSTIDGRLQPIFYAHDASR